MQLELRYRDVPRGTLKACSKDNLIEIIIPLQEVLKVNLTRDFEAKKVHLVFHIVDTKAVALACAETHRSIET